MWSEKRGDKVRYRERYKHPLTDKEIVISCTMPKDTSANRKKAQDIMWAKFVEKTKTVYSDGPKTIESIVDKYIEGTKTMLKPATIQRNFYACETFKRLLGPDTLVSRLNANYVKECFFDGNNGKYNERIKRFKIMMRWAYQNDYVDDITWLDKLRVLKNAEKKEKLADKFLEKEELVKLLENMNVEKWRLLAELCALSGMRVGEAIALEKKDVDFKSKLIHISKNYDCTTKQVVTPKTLKSKRDVYMQPELEKVCLAIKMYTCNMEKQSGVLSVLFMHSVDGSHLEYWAYNKYLKEMSMRVLRREITTHVMRHTHVALLAQNNVPMSVISERLGHDGTKITESIYMHVTKNLKEQYNSIMRDVSIL